MMLLGKKPKSEVQADWAVILERPEDELSKTKAAQAVKDTFPLAPEEAKDLVESTPIVLLDQLSFETAQQVKRSFEVRHVRCSLTNDTFTKRKCFRAVWPETPNLANFLTPVSLNLEKEKRPIPIIDETKAVPELPPPPRLDASQILLEEQKQLKHLTLELQKENEMLRAQLGETEHAVRQEEHKRFDEERGRIQAELERMSLAAQREKDNLMLQVDKLAGERRHLEGEFNRLQGENRSLQIRVKQLEEAFEVQKQDLDKLNALSKNQFTPEVQAELEGLRSESLRLKSTLREVQAQAGQYRSECTQAQRVLSEARAECEDLKRMLTQAQSSASEWKADFERFREEAQNQSSTRDTELDEWRQKANEWNQNYLNTLKENEYLRVHRSEELESLRLRNQQLTVQMEQAQRQIRDFVVQMEQQEWVEKRIKAANELAEREAELKEIVQQEEKLNQELSDVQQDLKALEAERFKTEEEIVKLKQAQKHIMEQAKLKEKKLSNRAVRPAAAENIFDAGSETESNSSQTL